MRPRLGGTFPEVTQQNLGPRCFSPLMHTSHDPSPRARIALPMILPFPSCDSLGLVVCSDPRTFPWDLFPAFVFKFIGQVFRSQQHLA